MKGKVMQRTKIPPKKMMIQKEKLIVPDVMESEKQVTFSPEVTLRVYEPQNLSPKKQHETVKSRLGKCSNQLHAIKKPQMKVSSSSPLLSKMKSDIIRKQSIHSRLTLYKPNEKSVFKRLGD